MNHILLVEDDPTIVSTLSEFLKTEGFSVTTANGQKAALEAGARGGIDLVLLDVSLADGNGFAVCSALKSDYDLPVIFLTASGDEYSTVTGLDLGAEDYIAKPFRPRELLSRIRGVLRRTGGAHAIIQIGNVTVDTIKGTASKNGHDLFLSALEYRLLLLLVTNRGAVLTRTVLLESLWDAAGAFVSDNTLTVYIKRLRDKIEDDPQNPAIIRTVRGMGYRVE